jgi:cytochrome b subunit of formate dehydrogenase
MEKIKYTMPYGVYSTIEVALRLSIKSSWKWRHDEFWRKDIKKSIEALKYIKNN